MNLPPSWRMKYARCGAPWHEAGLQGQLVNFASSLIFMGGVADLFPSGGGISHPMQFCNSPGDEAKPITSVSSIFTRPATILALW